ncbi:MAG: hypothetical protein ACREP6_00035, partial [Candidatus Binataceae bacterium]
MSKTPAAFGLVLLAVIATQFTIANACSGKQVLLQDDFQTLASNWGQTNTHEFVRNGRLVIEPALNHQYKTLSAGNLFSAMDACVGVTMVADGDNSFGAIAFWATDIDNLYEFYVTPRGYFGISRTVNGRWYTVVAYQAAPSVKKGNKQLNLLRLVTKDNRAIAYINGVQVA